MLRHLTISNIALIDKLSLDFEEGFSALTGETGAGKSILIEAVGLALGERAYRESIRTGAQKGSVEALFTVQEGTPAAEYLLEHELYDGEEVVLYRELYMSGKSVCRINGTLVSAAELKTVGDLLVDKHSCDLLVCQSIAPFLQQNLVSAGRTKLSVSEIDLHQLHIPVQEVKKIHDTVATLRLDAVAAAGFSTSRAKMADYIRAGRVSVNWQATERTDLPVKAGDVISCRGLGRCKLAETGALSRKGRINIELERYL